jgi:L-serine dehydratase
VPHSIFSLFKIGIGPSSSHTVGPMRAARKFALALRDAGVLAATSRLSCRLCGSLGATGRGHGTDTAVLLGLHGEKPDTVDVDAIAGLVAGVRAGGGLALLGEHRIAFEEARDLVFLGEELPSLHPNAMHLVATGEAGETLLERTYYSVGGGYVVEEDGGELQVEGEQAAETGAAARYAYTSASELIAFAGADNLTIAEIVRSNERLWRSDAEIDAAIARIWQAMQDCVRRGLEAEGVLPGRFRVRRRARLLHQALTANPEAALSDPMQIIDWVNLYALAVNEENASGGRVVTAPTNGAAGIVPAVLLYFTRFLRGTPTGVADFLMTAGAIGLLYKENASISGAEVGCQGEVGVACSMAAAGLSAVMGGTPEQVENAAEIAMEHHLGLTCDPVGGLVQIPCIERNAIASVQAINAARMALRGDGKHFISLDQVIRTMRETGADMMNKYKETATGGLAVNIVEC